MNLKLLNQRTFSTLMFAKFISLIGTQMQNFALALYVLRITGSATKFAIVSAIAIIPNIFLGPIAGVFADWFDRKKMIIYLDIINGIVVGIYAIIFKINGGISLTQIYILAIILSMISSLYMPTISTVIPSIIKRDELLEANGIDSFVMSLGNLASPVIAGVLFGTYGLFIILIANLISFILAGISEMFLNIPKINKQPEKFDIQYFLSDFTEGIQFIKNKKLMRNIIVLALILNFAFNPMLGLGVTFISKQILKITDLQYGIMESMFIIAMTIAPFIASQVSRKYKMGKVLFLSIFNSSILIGILATIVKCNSLNLFSNNFMPYIGILIIGFIISMITTISNITIGTIFQQQVPLQMMGRVNSVMSTCCIVAIPAGQMIFGLLLDKVDTAICVTICALILFITINSFRKSLCEENEYENSSIEVTGW